MRAAVALLGLALIATPALAAPGDMSVRAFLAKAEALEAKGPLALLSSDLGLLKAEGQAAGAAYRDRLRQERTVGRPSSCPPQNSRMNSNQLLVHLRAYPVVARAQITMRTAMADYFIRTYPCPAR